MNEENENLLFQLEQLKAEGKKVNGLIGQTEEKMWKESEKELSPERPRWKVIDKDEGIIFAEKELPDGRKKHMDIIDFEDKKTGEKHRDIILYEVGNEIKTIMTRNNRKSAYESKSWFEETRKRETKRSQGQ
jgi:hypothetical protein